MPYEPSLDAILINRRRIGDGPAPDEFRILESYYEPSRREADTWEIVSTDPTAFNLPPTVILDRYCSAPGVAPFTEIRVTHVGNFDGLAFTPYDNVDACRVTCTIGVTLTAPAVQNGRATLTATATGAQGPVLFSLDGFDTPGLEPNGPQGTTLRTFPDQRTGRYTVTVKESRAGGCTATATLVLATGYGPRYYLSFRNPDEALCELTIDEREYTGETEVLPYAQREAVVVDWPGGGTDHVYSTLLKGAECQLSLYQSYDDQFRPLFSGDERLHRVTYREGGAIVFTGYLLPEQYDILFLAPETNPPFNLSATDGLGTLSTIPFAGPAGERLRGDWTVLQTLLYCLGKLELDLPLHVLFNLYPAPATANHPALLQIKVDVGQYLDGKGQPWDCGRIVKELLTSFGARLYQQAGTWRLERLSELGTGPLPYQVFAPDGTRQADTTHVLLEAVGTPESGQFPQWRHASQRQGIRGAVSTVRVEAEPGELANLLAFALPTNADLPAALPDNWRGSNLPAEDYSQLIYQGKDKTPALRLFGTTDFKGSPFQAPWIETAIAPPLPNPRQTGPPHGNEGLRLRYTVKAFGFTPVEAIADASVMPVAIRFGNAWVGDEEEATANPSGFSDTASALFLTKENATQDVVGQAGPTGQSPPTSQVGPQPVYVRFYIPSGGPTPTTVDITNLRLEYDDDVPEAADFTSAYVGNTGNLVTRTDEGTTLFHLDTPHARYAGTLLDAASLPVQGWYEPASLGQVRELGDYLVRDRLSWQFRPAQVLTGTLRAPFAGPGALLTDPAETTPGVYALTGAVLDAASATWQVSAVQLLPLTPTPEEIPEGAIYFDDLYAWQAEDGAILTYEDA